MKFLLFYPLIFLLPNIIKREPTKFKTSVLLLLPLCQISLEGLEVGPCSRSYLWEALKQFRMYWTINFYGQGEGKLVLFLISKEIIQNFCSGGFYNWIVFITRLLIDIKTTNRPTGAFVIDYINISAKHETKCYCQNYSR